MGSSWFLTATTWGHYNQDGIIYAPERDVPGWFFTLDMRSSFGWSWRHYSTQTEPDVSGFWTSRTEVGYYSYPMRDHYEEFRENFLAPVRE